jgi:HAD superfamily hydrolase (TIGR01509 family)
MKRISEYQTYLIDLDGTLLELSFKEFTEEYYGRLVEAVSEKIEAGLFIKALNAGIEAMMKNCGGKTNEEAFYEAFEKVAGPVDAELADTFRRFYEVEFKKLSHHGSPKKGAENFIRKLKSLNKKVVLATNPVFPIEAIEERLRWAGLRKEDFDFITSFEVMKACKPSEIYFRQVLDATDAEPDQAVMIGDDPELDAGALQAGIDVIIIGSRSPVIYPKNVRISGSFEELMKEL